MEDRVFYVHDQILFFSGSDFFRDLLDGDWAENGNGKGTKRRSVVTVASSSEVVGEEELGTVEADSESTVELEEAQEEGLICRVHLVEEEAGPFQDLLFHLYPHLTATLNWENGEYLSALPTLISSSATIQDFNEG